MALDVGDADAAAAAVTSVVDATGRIDVSVNNAGTGAIGPLEETTDVEAHRIFEVNLFGPMRLAHPAVTVMRAQGSGRIVNVTSMNDVLPAPFGGWYSASKAALASASAVLDAEVHGFGIFVTVVAPGFFRTEMAASLASFQVMPESAYRAALDGLLAVNVARLESAADPDDVAAAIEACIRSADPPARIVVGTDAEEMTKLIHDTSADDFARLLAGVCRRSRSIPFGGGRRRKLNRSPSPGSRNGERCGMEGHGRGLLPPSLQLRMVAVERIPRRRGVEDEAHDGGAP